MSISLIDTCHYEADGVQLSLRVQDKIEHATDQENYDKLKSKLIESFSFHENIRHFFFENYKQITSHDMISIIYSDRNLNFIEHMQIYWMELLQNSDMIEFIVYLRRANTIEATESEIAYKRIPPKILERKSEVINEFLIEQFNLLVSHNFTQIEGTTDVDPMPTLRVIEKEKDKYVIAGATQVVHSNGISVLLTNKTLELVAEQEKEKLGEIMSNLNSYLLHQFNTIQFLKRVMKQFDNENKIMMTNMSQVGKNETFICDIVIIEENDKVKDIGSKGVSMLNTIAETINIPVESFTLETVKTNMEKVLEAIGDSQNLFE